MRWDLVYLPKHFLRAVLSNELASMDNTEE